jgi:hypothetical protein
VKRLACWLLVGLVVGALGCSTPAKKVKKLRLGMTPDEVRDRIGDPYTIRAAKVFEDGHSTEIWEYTPSFGINPKTFWIYFEDQKVVQWGQPGDFSGKAGQDVPVDEYKGFKSAR